MTACMFAQLTAELIELKLNIVIAHTLSCVPVKFWLLALSGLERNIPKE